MDNGRRGFLVGAAKLLGGALALSVLPQEGVARAVVGEKLVWTPEQDRLERNAVLHRIIMAPGTVIQNCIFSVSPDFHIEAGQGMATIQDCHFTNLSSLPLFAPGQYIVKGTLRTGNY